MDEEIIEMQKETERELQAKNEELVLAIAMVYSSFTHFKYVKTDLVKQSNC